jgi:hypothetical protein
MTTDGSDTDDGSGFFATLPAFARFADVADPARYVPLPDDWLIGVTDVVGSTAAVAAGRYKAVNLAGASAISAVMNALRGASFPFVFGGDGATFAVWPEAREVVADTLARTVRWCAEDLGLELRAALVPVRAIRAAGRGVEVARFQAAPQASYAMFAGGGVAWATAAMKAGNYGIPSAPPGARPDLSGLSCRWTPMPARRGAIVSLLVQAREGVDARRVAGLLAAVIAEIAKLDGEGTPVPVEGPGFGWPPEGLDLEARAARKPGTPLWRERIKLVLATLVAWILDVTGWKVGGFDPARYRRTTARNADFRKFDDGLRLTIDCDAATQSRIETLLRGGAAEGLVDWGLHAQSAALMTCIVPSFMRDDHLHFVDGADGGYTRAAMAIKARSARPSA